MSIRRREILGPVAVFALSGLAVLIMVALAGALALRGPQYVGGAGVTPGA